MAKKCTLCGGSLDSTKRCTLCGLDNTKNDDQYKGYMNRNHHDDVPLTHVHHEPSMHRYDYEQPKKQKKQKKESSHGKTLGIIIAVFGLLPSLFGLIATFADSIVDEFSYVEREEYTISDNAYEEWLPAGLYEVGVHIPEGTYEVVLDWGTAGTVEVLDCVDGILQSNEYFHLEVGQMEVVTDVVLSEGKVLRVSPEISLYVYSSDADPNEIFTEWNELTEHYPVGEDMMVAGKDFSAGVYDISYTASEESEVGTVTIYLWNNEYQTATLVDNLCFDDSYGDTLYCNVPFEAGSYIYVSGLKDVKLVPSLEVKAGFNYSETSLDDGEVGTL